jgi:hypothetical protein
MILAVAGVMAMTLLERRDRSRKAKVDGSEE